MKTTPEIDGHFPYRGPCGICGGDDARHRLFDALLEMHRAGDSVEDLAREYNLPVAAVRAVVAGYVSDEEVSND